MSRRNLVRYALLPLLLVAGAFGLAGGLTGQESPPAASKDAADDPFSPPADATPPQLMKFIQKMRREEPSSPAEARKVLNGIEKAADRILAAKDADEELVIDAARFKFAVYRARVEFLQDEKSQDAAKAFAKSLEKSPKKALQSIGKQEMLTTRISSLDDMKAEERKQLLAEIVELVQQSDDEESSFQLAMTFAVQAYEDIAPKDAADAYDSLSKLFLKSKNEEIASYAKKFQGVARRLRLPGNEIDVEGTTLAGKAFDWKSYRGKVVLVDFWATWCGPCIRELPNVLENYEKYHSKGFEVVGISLDDDVEALQAFLKEKKIPWVTLFGKDEATRGWEHPMVDRYGIMGIPTVILVDQKGKVVSLEARGPELGRQLEKLLGDKPAADSK